jgi:hypothetical protein
LGTLAKFLKIMAGMTQALAGRYKPNLKDRPK